MAKKINTTKEIINHFSKLISNAAVVSLLDSRGGKLNGAMCKQAQDILNSDGTYSEVTGGKISVVGCNCVLTLDTDCRARPAFVLDSLGIRG